jgi:dihydroorotate dehydrogenase electron transfer subunit
MVHCNDGLTFAYDPLLPRPMSYHRFRDVDGERQFAILFDVRGRGTTWLARRRAGEALNVLGPLSA